MTFEEWIEDYSREIGDKFTFAQRDLMLSAWIAGRVAIDSDSAGKEGCQAFNAQEEIAKLREELNEIRSSLEMLKAPVYVVPPTPRDYDLVIDPYKVTCGPVDGQTVPADPTKLRGVSTPDFEPEVTAGEGFNIHDREERLEHMRKSSAAYHEWQVGSLEPNFPPNGDKVTDFHNWRNSKIEERDKRQADFEEGVRMHTKEEFMRLFDRIRDQGKQGLEEMKDFYGDGFKQRCADLEAEGFEPDSAFMQALDERHDRKPKFPGY